MLLLSRIFSGSGVLKDVAAPGGDHFPPVLTETFNYGARMRACDLPLSIVYVPGFGSDALSVDVGPLGRVAQQEGCDFTRFSHFVPGEDPRNLTYSSMVANAASVIQQNPNPHVVVVGSSFGAGMLPWIVEQVQRIDLRKICGVFGWAAVPPAAVVALVERQPGFSDFVNNKGETVLQVHSPTLPAPFPMTFDQYLDLGSFGKGPREKLSRLPEDSVCLLVGDQDPVARLGDSRVIMQHLSLGPARVFPYPGGHKPPERMIEAGLRSVIRQARRNAQAQAVYM